MINPNGSMTIENTDKGYYKRVTPEGFLVCMTKERDSQFAYREVWKGTKVFSEAVYSGEMSIMGEP